MGTRYDAWCLDCEDGMGLEVYEHEAVHLTKRTTIRALLALRDGELLDLTMQCHGGEYIRFEWLERHQDHRLGTRATHGTITETVQAPPKTTIRVAVFRDEETQQWIARGLHSDFIATGNTAVDAIHSLVLALQAEEAFAKRQGRVPFTELPATPSRFRDWWQDRRTAFESVRSLAPLDVQLEVECDLT